jgi:sugar lactone lactonase YvrE
MKKIRLAVHAAGVLEPSAFVLLAIGTSALGGAAAICREMMKARPSSMRSLFCLPLLLPLIQQSAFGGILYVTNSENASIAKISSTGNTLQTSLLINPHGIAFPEGIVLDAAGNLFVADEGTLSVHKIAADGNNSELAAGVATPAGLAIDRQNNLYFTDAGSGDIYKVTPSGSVSIFVSRFKLNAPNGAFGLAFDANGNLYDAIPDSNEVFEITPSGVISTFATGLNSPSGLAFDRNGNLFVSNYFGNSITQISPTGIQSPFVSGLRAPVGLAFDNVGNLFVAEHTTDGSIVMITPSGNVSTFASNLGGSPNFIAIPVPEPSTIFMCAVGVLVLAALATFKRLRDCSMAIHRIAAKPS